jgi:hypothetical protein
MRAKKYITLGNVVLVALLIAHMIWLWFLYRVARVALDILIWGGEI